MRRIYVASSWRNTHQPAVVTALRNDGHRVYDFRNPTQGYNNANGLARGFHWSEMDPNWQSWSIGDYVRLLFEHPVAEQGFRSDWEAMRWADTGVLVLPSDRSAHLEAGYFAGAGKDLFVLMPEHQEPELMYRMANGIVETVSDLLAAMRQGVAA